MSNNNLDIIKGKILSNSDEAADLREEYQMLVEIFKHLELTGYVEQRFLGPYYSITDVLTTDSMKFMVYLASADKKIKHEEIALIEIVLGVNFEDYGIQYFENAGVFKPEYADRTPMSFLCLLNVGMKKFKNGEGETPGDLAIAYLNFLKDLGKVQCAIDFDVESEEVIYYKRYIQNLEKYVLKEIQLPSAKQQPLYQNIAMPEQNNSPRFCSNCGTKLGGNVNFCPNCGMKINSSANNNFTSSNYTRSASEKRVSIKQKPSTPPLGFVAGGNLKKDAETKIAKRAAEEANRVFFSANAHLMERKVNSNRTDFLKVSKSFNTFFGSKTKIGSVFHNSNKVEKWESVDEGKLIITRNEINYIGNRKHITIKLNQYIRSNPTDYGFQLFKVGRETPYVFDLKNSNWRIFAQIVDELLTGKLK